MDGRDYNKKIKFGANAALLSAIIALPLFFFGAPVIVLALPALVFEVAAWKLFVTDEHEMGPSLKKAFPYSGTAFNFSHLGFYFVWGWTYNLTLAFHPDPTYLDKYYVPTFGQVFIAVLFSIFIHQYNGMMSISKDAYNACG